MSSLCWNAIVDFLNGVRVKVDKHAISVFGNLQDGVRHRFDRRFFEHILRELFPCLLLGEGVGECPNGIIVVIRLLTVVFCKYV